MSGIPQWAIERAIDAVNTQSKRQSIGSQYRHYGYGDLLEPPLSAFAAYIAEHEQEPVDPLLFEAREIAISESYGGRARWAETWREKIMRGDDDREDRVKVALAALKRGIELGRHHA